MWILIAFAALALQTPAPRTTLTPDLQRAQQHDRRGWESIDARDFARAAESFEAAIQIHPGYADALYGLGKARMALQQYEAAARVLERSRDAYAHAGTEEAEYRLLANAAQQNQIAVLRRRLADLESPASSSASQGIPAAGSNQAQDLKQQIRTLQGERDAGPTTGTLTPVPSFVSLTLGSAYFHLERLPDAEREFRAALAVEPKFGEALSNLALVCLLTGRAEEAQKYVRIAEEAKFTVNPELKRRIRDALQKE
jgi:tetratricopeptide (TPR) repeat protein